MSSLQATRAHDPAHAGLAEAETNELYELHGARVYAFCLGRLGDREEAADAVQDTFAKAWIALRDGCEVRQPLAWLLTIAGNVCASHYRARQARPIETPLNDETLAAFTPQPVDELVGLPTALSRLPDEQRRAFVLRELRGCSYEEIGLDLGVSYASVAALLHRSRRAVAASLRGAGQRALVVIPLPQFIRSAFESGAATATVAATAAGAVLLVAPQLGILPSNDGAEAASPARGVAAASFWFDARSFPGLRLSGVFIGSRPGGSLSAPSASSFAGRGAGATAAPTDGLAAWPDFGSNNPATRVDPTLTLPEAAEPSNSLPAPQDAVPPAEPRGPAPTPETPPSDGQSGDPGLQGTARPENPGGQGNGHEKIAGPQGNGPPADPGAQGNGPPADPGAQGNGPPADPGAQGNGPPADPGAQGNGPPADPGAQGNGPPADPGAPPGSQPGTG